MISRSSRRRHLPFMVAVAAGIAGLVVFSLLNWSGAVLGTACLFFLTYLVFTAARLPRLTANYLKANAASTDEPAPVIFAITFATIVISLGFLFRIINKGDAQDPVELLLALASVALGWFTIHTMGALHYAHLYWRPDERAPERDGRHRGLDFPGHTEPGVWDFLYFAFVIGMTAQTSDVAITSTAMRRFNLLHGVVSFFFNTVLVVLAVNVAVSFAGPGATPS
jgi:uncharacterized membrane protein